MASLLEPLRHPVFARFFAGQAVSQVGDYVFYVALPWQVLLLTGSAVDLGGVFAAYSASQIGFLLLGGVIVDRFPRRTLVVLSDVLQGILVGGLAALGFAGVLGIPHLYVFGVLFGASQAFAMPATGAFLPETVPVRALQPANSLYQGSREVAGIAGPALGAAVIALGGTSAAFAVDALTFGVSAVLLATVRVSRKALPAATPRRRTSPLADLREGWRYTARVPWLWITILVFAVVNAAEAGPRNVVLPTYVGVELGGGSTAIGLFLSVMAVGTLLGFLVPNLFPKVRDRGLVAYTATAAIGFSTLLLGFGSSIPAVLALGFARGLAVAVFSLMWATALGEQVEESVRGRVYSLDEFGSFALLPVSMAVCGVLADALGARIVFLVGGLLVVACSLVGLFYPPAGRFEKPASPRYP